jgi:hypothetical protein
MRALPEPTRQRRQALAKVRERWPDVTSSQIFTTFGDQGVQRGGLPRTPGGYLRRLLAREAPGEIVRRPSKSTLHEDLKALRAASRDQKPQTSGPRGGCEIRVNGVDYRADRPQFVDGPEATAVVRQAFGPVERAMFRVLGIRQYLLLRRAAS